MDRGDAKETQILKAKEQDSEQRSSSNKVTKDVSQEKNSGENGTFIEPPRQRLNVLHGSFWLTRIVIVRYMGFLYGVAYLVSLLQNKELIGKDGLLPADLHMTHIRDHVGKESSFTLLSYAPSLLWFVDCNEHLDFWLDAIAWAGLALSSFMVMTGAGNWPLLLCQWLLYHSLVNVGQTWFSFGWESQILETGFLTIFLCPMLSLSSLPKSTPPSFIIIFAYRWLIFRIMLGAGLIKIRGDKCWRDLTCMNYHYETQPVPNPLSYFMHQSPEFMHKFEVLSNHFIELIAPCLLMLSRKFAMIGGAIQILFQIVLIISGNLSFLNWLTILPSLACFDDASLEWLFQMCGGRKRVDRARAIVQANQKSPQHFVSGYIRRVFNICIGLLIAYLSIPVVQNLFSQRQAMNSSFDPLRLVNTYGAFGSVTKKRTEVIFQGTSSLEPYSPTAVWEEYEFKCKPGNVKRRPCIISPYHYRLDWLMWFAAFQDYQHNPWMIHLAGKLLVNSNLTDSLIEHNPFKARDPPKFVRAEHYRYWFTKLGTKEVKSGAWWKRKRVGSYLPVVSLNSLQSIFMQMKWKWPVS